MPNLIKTGMVNATLSRLGLNYVVLAGPKKMAASDTSLGLERLFSGPLNLGRAMPVPEPRHIGSIISDKFRDLSPTAAVRTGIELTRRVARSDPAEQDSQALFTQACDVIREALVHDLEKRDLFAFIRLVDRPQVPHRLMTPEEFLEAVRSEKSDWQNQTVYNVLAGTNGLFYLRCLADLSEPLLPLDAALAWPLGLAVASGLLGVYALSRSQQGRRQDLVYQTFYDWCRAHSQNDALAGPS